MATVVKLAKRNHCLIPVGKNHNCYRHHINISTCACVGERWREKKKMFPAGLAGYSDTEIARAQRQTVKDEDVLFLKQHVRICAQSEGRLREGEAYVTEGVNVFIAVVFTLVSHSSWCR